MFANIYKHLANTCWTFQRLYLLPRDSI